MTVEKVTRGLLKALKSEETTTLTLPTYAAVESGKNTAYQFAKILGCKFECKVSAETTLTITRHDYNEATS